MSSLFASNYAHVPGKTLRIHIGLAIGGVHLHHGPMPGPPGNWALITYGQNND